MTNQLATCSLIAKKSLAILENMLGFGGAANRDYESEYSSNQARGYSPGVTINIKKPPRFTYRTGKTSTPQATVETTVPLTLAQGGTDINFTSLERTVSLQQLDEKLHAAMATIANEVDRQGLALAATAAFNTVGTPGTFPTTQAAALALLTAAQQKLDENSAPRDNNRSLISSPAMNASLLQGLQGLFNGQGALSKQYDRGIVQNPIGLDFVMDQNVQATTNGTQPATGGTVNGASQTGATLLVNTASITGTIVAGQTFTIGGVFAVNPQNRQSTGSLQQFVVTAAAASGATQLSISPAIVVTGAFQNVTASPANTAALTFTGAASASYTNSIAMHKDAFTLATVPLYTPTGGKGVIDASTQEYKGINLRVIEFYDGVNDNFLMRFDVLFGWAATYPELAVRVVA